MRERGRERGGRGSEGEKVSGGEREREGGRGSEGEKVRERGGERE